MCCENGETPLCIINDGEAEGLCRKISLSVSEDPDLLMRVIVDIIAERVGETYRDDALQNISFRGGVISYESSDGYVQVRATQVLAERGNPDLLAPMR